MSAQLQTHAEIVKIAHLLQVPPSEIEYLAVCEPETLIDFRLQLVEVFYGDEGSNLKRFAKVGNLLPASVIASLTKEAVGPVLAARIAGFVDPKQAASVVSKLPTAFVVDIATAIDPRRVGPVIGRLDNGTVERVALELIKRHEYVTMGQFVGFASDEILRISFNFSSDEALLRTAFVAEDKDRISAALTPQSDERIASIIKTAAKGDLWPEAMDLLSQLSDEQYIRVINISGSIDAKSLDKMVAATTKHDCWAILVPAYAQMEDPNNGVAALLRGTANDIRAFGETIIEDEAWEDSAELFAKLTDENRDALVTRLRRLKLDEVFERAAVAA
ncbi:MAG: hypothetical protein JHC98_12255 [Thermoleophilaceae bacterium]|nr:hypothetical protein [Thermoleophilaceae bacterium]